MKQKGNQFNCLMQFFLFGIAFFALYFTPGLVSAGLPEQNTSATISVFVDDTQPLAVHGFQAQLPLIFEIPDGVYLFKKSVHVEFNASRVSASLDLPLGEMITDELTGEDVEVYSGQLILEARISFEKNYDFKQGLSGIVFYQGCAQKICQREREQAFAVQLTPDEKTLVDLEQDPVEHKSIMAWIKNIDMSEVLGRGFWFALLIAFVAGLLTSLTPCVLPIIPLTLAFIGVTPLERKSTRLSHTIIFTCGMILMYATLGVTSAWLGKGLGFAYKSPIFLLFLVVFFFIMALWMFGVLNSAFFSKIQTAVIRHEPQGKFRYLYAGLTVGFLAAPCVGPVVGPLLVYIASTHDLLVGFALMLAYALGLSILFFVLGFFSNHWITSLGQHTKWVKNILGTLLILVALFYLQILLKPVFNVRIPHDDYFDYDYQHALVVAAEQNKGLLVDFYADWCVGCHEIEQLIWSQPTVRAAVKQQFVPVKIDCTTKNEQCDGLSDQFQLAGLPTILFVDAQGQEILRSRLTGSGMSAQEFLDHVKEQELRLTP